MVFGVLAHELAGDAVLLSVSRGGDKCDGVRMDPKDSVARAFAVDLFGVWDREAELAEGGVVESGDSDAVVLRRHHAGRSERDRRGPADWRERWREGGGGGSNRMLWSFPALLCDIVFLSWIYMSLVTMMKILREQNETYKLELYTRLSSTILLFVSLFGCLTLVVLLSRIGFFVWPWTLLWAETVAWEVLNFAVLAAVCFLWRPSPTSQFLAQAKQLPTSEGGREGGRGDEEGIEFSIGSQFSITDEDEDEDEGDGDLRAGGRDASFS